MEGILQSFMEDWSRFTAYAPRLLATVLVLLIAWIAGRILARLVVAVLRRTGLQQIHEPFFRITTTLLLLFPGLVVALNILGLDRLAVSLLAGGGITAIIIGFAFREIGENFLAGFFLAFSRPFNTGDVIRTEDNEGRVREITMRYTHLRTDDGRDVYVPNSQIFNKPLTNFTRDGLRRTAFSVGIDYNHDASTACALLDRTVREVTGVLPDPAPGAFIQALAPQYVELQVYFWVDTFNKGTHLGLIRTGVMDACRKALLDGGYTVSPDIYTNIFLKQDPGAGGSAA